MLNKKIIILSFVIVIAIFLVSRLKLANFSAKQDHLSSNMPNLVNNQVPNFVLLVKQVGNTVVSITVAVANTHGPEDGINVVIESESLSKNTHHIYGSGFIISEDGYIVTSAHVINNALNIIVQNSNKLKFPAQVVGIDRKSDVALLKIDSHNLPIVKIANQKQLEVGQWVAAIGGQFGLDNSVTHRIVSAKDRYLPGYANLFIQTDVPINPGSSGGPLFNLAGEVVGMNSQIYSRGGGYMGVSFAIPIDIVMQVVKQLKVSNHNTCLIAYGIEFINLEKLSSSTNKVVVLQVKPGSIADKAGMIVGDRIIAINGQKVGNTEQINQVSIGQHEINLEINRAGQQLFIKLILNK